MKSIDHRKNHDQVDQQPLYGPTFDFSSPNSSAEIKELENKYLSAIKKLIDKYEALYNTHDNYKSEMNDKINHYIALNNSLYARNTELGQANKEKHETLNRAIKDNINLKADLEGGRAVLERTRAMLDESISSAQINQKHIDTLKIYCAQREEEVAKWKSDYQNLEKKYRDEKAQLITQKNETYDRLMQLEELSQKENNLLEKEITSLKTQAFEKEKIIFELEEALVESNAKLSNALFENESLKKELKEKEEVIDKLVLLKENLNQSLDYFQRQIEQIPKEYIFEGKIVNGLKQGKCLYKCSAYSYEGEFVNDVFCGTGKCVYQNPRKTLEGEFDSNGNFKGNKMTFPEFTYTGGIVKNCMEGKGYIEVANSFIVEGLFKGDSFDQTKKVLVVNLTTGDEHETRWVPDKKALLSEDGNVKVTYAVDFERGTFREMQNK